MFVNALNSSLVNYWARPVGHLRQDNAQKHCSSSPLCSSATSKLFNPVAAFKVHLHIFSAENASCGRTFSTPLPTLPGLGLEFLKSLHMECNASSSTNSLHPSQCHRDVTCPLRCRNGLITPAKWSRTRLDGVRGCDSWPRCCQWVTMTIPWEMIPSRLYS